MTRTLHPASEELLQKLLLGQLPSAEADRLAAEYANDGRLAALAESLTGQEDTLLTQLKNQETAIDPQAEELVSRITQRLQAVLTASNETAVTNAADATLPPSGSVAFSAAANLPKQLEYYQPLKILGQGGMGTVYLALDTRLGREVALKTLRRELAVNRDAKERFLREARAAAKLSHDHIIPIYYVGEAEGTPFLAMPLLKGQPLDELLKRARGPLPLEQAIRIGRETASALAAAHEAGLIHRDIKPANIWLEGSNGRVKVLDFGLAKSAAAAAGQDDTNLTAYGAIVGTPAYMAPEQAGGNPVDARADLFSLGCVLYELLTGQRAFGGTDTMSILMNLASHTPPPPHTVVPNCPPALSRLVMQLLEKNPAARPKSAQAVMEALDGLQAAPQVEPRKSVTIKPQAAGKSWIVASIVAIACLAILPIGYLFGAQIIRIVTNQGQIVIETDGAGIEVVIKDGEGKVLDKETKRAFAFKAGEYNLEVTVTDAGGEQRFVTDHFRLKRNGKQVIDARWEVAKARPTVDAKDPVREAPRESVASASAGNKNPAPEKAPTAVDPSEEGEFVPLFNGKDFAGWNLKNPATIKWSISEHAVRGANSGYHPSKGGAIFTARADYRDFHFRCEVLAGQRGETWIYFRHNTTLEHGARRGYGVPNPDPEKLTNTDGWGIGSLYEDVFQVGNQRVAAAKVPGPKVQAGEWYKLEIIARGESIRVLVNGTTTTEFQATDPPARQGSFGFGCPILSNLAVRNVEVREFDSAKTAAAKPAAYRNPIGMEFALIPKGKSWLGGGGGKPGEKEIEFKQDFYLGLYPVTQEEWEQVMGSNPAHFSRNGFRKNVVKDISDADLQRFPVEGVSYADVQAFLAKLNERDKQPGWEYRLPTQAEWEYACRGGPLADRSESAFLFYAGKPSDGLPPDQANYGHPGGPNRTVRVGLHAPNKLGLYDMHANVLEWCSDVGRNQIGEETRIARGGSWNDPAGTAASYTQFLPTVRYASLGLRVARVPVTKASTADADRRAAEFVLSTGGFVGVFQDRNYREIKAQSDLPREAFELALAFLSEKPEVNDDSLACFADCENLTHLYLKQTLVTNAGLAHFQRCKRLKGLDLHNAFQISDAGLAHFAGCKDFVDLNLTNLEKVTDAGLAYFAGSTEITSIHLAATKVSEAGLAHFRDCKELRYIDLWSTPFDDRALEFLANHPKLRLVKLAKTKVTEAGVTKLAAALPDCRIEWDGGVLGPNP